MHNNHQIPRYLMLAGDATDIKTWSNIPYHLLKAGQKEGFLQAGLPLQYKRIRHLRHGWNLWQKLRHGQSGGYGYSQFCIQQLLAQARLRNEPLELLSHCTFMPIQPWPEHWQVSYYIDATTRQLFEAYGHSKYVSPRIYEQTLVTEQRNFQKAERIICMGRWAADAVIQSGIDSAKVFVVPAGANLDESQLQHLSTSTASTDLQPLRLGFIGEDWKRKGLIKLLAVAVQLQTRGWEVEVPVIGPPLNSLKHPLLRPLGFVDKACDLPLFVTTVRSFHFGCLFSRVEAFGISNRECLRLGVPVLGAQVGGIPDTVPNGLGHLFKPDASVEEIADTIERYLKRPKAYAELKQKVYDRAKEFTWAVTVQQLQDIWRHPTSAPEI